MLDDVDRRIIIALQHDASLPISEIAESVGLSQSPCWRRIKRLRDLGIIRAIRAEVDREKVGLSFLAYAFVKLNVPSRAHLDAFDYEVSRWSEVISCERVTGSMDYLLRVVERDIRHYDEFLRNKLLSMDIVSDVRSSIVVATVKDTIQLPLALENDT